jgi:2-amino-4-hydroxy-6-hydroxymethyldihydropteridine diphosphokinase
MSRAAEAEASNHGVETFLGIGSNLEKPRQQISRAFSALQTLADSKDARCSPLYLSPPMGPQAQPDYVNAVVRLVTGLAPTLLLREIQAIERAQGRERGAHWGPRTLDIDLLVYGDLVLDSRDLQVPHPGIAQRAFVLYPLCDIAPDLTIPGQGRVSELVKCVDAEGLVMIGDLIDIERNRTI